MTDTSQPEPRTRCGRACRHWSYDMDGSYCAHPVAMAESWAGFHEHIMSQKGLCFHGNDSEPARDELFEPVEEENHA